MSLNLGAYSRKSYIGCIEEESSSEETSDDETTSLLIQSEDANYHSYGVIEHRSSTKTVPGPDGAEAWAVAGAACFINFVMAGLGRMSGILYVAFIDIYEIDRMQASLPFSVRSSTRNLLGPVVGILGQKYSVRSVTIIGGVLGALSAAACFFVEDIVWMTIVWGGLNGIGTALTTTLVQVTIGQHFKKHRTTAAGISFSGGCVGSFLFPVILEILLNTYNLGGTFLIIAGILMHVIPAAMVLKKPTWLNKNKPLILISEANEDKGPDANANEPQVQDSETENYRHDLIVSNIYQKKDLGLPSISYTPNIDPSINFSENVSENLLNDRRINTHLLWDNRKLVIRLLTDDFTLQCPDPEFNQNKSFTNDPLIKEIKDLFSRIVTDVQNDKISEGDTVSDMSFKANDKFEDKCTQLENKTYINGGPKSQQIDFSAISSNPLNSLSFYLEHLFERDKNIIIQSFSKGEHEHTSEILEELSNIHKILAENKTNIYLCSHSTTSLFWDSNSINFDDNVEHPNTFSSHIKTALKLHTKPLFILICLCRSVHFLTFMPVVTTIVDFSMDKGLLAADGKYVIAALSLGDLMGRLCLGWITDKGYVSLPRYMLFVMILQGASTATLSFMDSRASIMSAIAVFGLLQGSIFVRHPVLVARYLGSHEQSIAMGCINFFSGILAFALPNYIGYFRDTIGSYNGIFYINGAVGAFIGLLWIFEPYFYKQSISRARRNRQAQV